jgi:hypothetical protein
VAQLKRVSSSARVFMRTRQASGAPLYKWLKMKEMTEASL